VRPPGRTLGALVVTGLLLVGFTWLLVADEARRASRLDAAWTAAESADLEAVPMPPASALRSRWVSQTVPEVIALGKTATATFVFQNIGAVRWIRGTPAEARLGVLGDDRTFFDLGLAQGWPAPERLAAQAEEIVEVGQVATFRVGLRGSVTGRHHIRVRPVVDGVTWMDDDGAYFDVVISAHAP
jgi:hypothetical protein